MRQQARSAVVSALRYSFGFAGGMTQRIVYDALATEVLFLPLSIPTVETRRGPIKFFCLDEAGAVPSWRANTFHDKEPETLEWIDSFKTGDVMWDIGANVGLYSLYAAIDRSVRVLAFEPSAGNYFLLNRNIEINGMNSCVRAYCLALSDEDGIGPLNFEDTQLGGAKNAYNDAVDYKGRMFSPVYRQRIVSFSIDSFLARFDEPFPNHIKIDVDGIESKIVRGAKATLRDPRLRSVLVELDEGMPTEVAYVTECMEDAGLKLESKRHAAMFDGGPYQSMFNFLFRRP